MTQNALAQLLLRELERDLAVQSPAGSFPAGRNGAYGDPETPARTTSHYLVALCQAYRVTGDRRFKEAAKRAAGYIKGALEHSPGCVVMRHAPGKDHANGVLGPAFIIEALHAAGVVLDDSEAMALAHDRYRLQPFDEQLHVWKTLDPSGGACPVDGTFNHQLYFAAAANLLFQSSSLDERIALFLEHLPATMGLREDGRVVHAISQPEDTGLKLRRAVSRRIGRSPDPSAKERDYHLYNCYAFALLTAGGAPVLRSVGEDRMRSIASFADGRSIARLLARPGWSVPQRSGTETRLADKQYFDAVVLDKAVDGAEASAYLAATLGPDHTGSLVSPDPVMYRARCYRYWRIVQHEAATTPIL